MGCKQTLKGYTQIDLGNGKIVTAGTDSGFEGTTANQFAVDEEGNLYASFKEGANADTSWADLKLNTYDTNTGKTSSFSEIISGLGANVGKVLDIANNISDAYTKATGKTIIESSASQVKQGNISNTDLNTLANLFNSAINKLKTYGVYLGIGITGVLVYTILKNKKTSKKGKRK